MTSCLNVGMFLFFLFFMRRHPYIPLEGVCSFKGNAFFHLYACRLVRYKSLAIARVVATLKVNLRRGNLHLLFHVQDGASPLYIASQYGHTAVVEILIQAGADVHQARTMV